MQFSIAGFGDDGAEDELTGRAGAGWLAEGVDDFDDFDDFAVGPAGGNESGRDDEVRARGWCDEHFGLGGAEASESESEFVAQGWSPYKGTR